MGILIKPNAKRPDPNPPPKKINRAKIPHHIELKTHSSRTH